MPLLALHSATEAFIPEPADIHLRQQYDCFKCMSAVSGNLEALVQLGTSYANLAPTSVNTRWREVYARCVYDYVCMSGGEA